MRRRNPGLLAGLVLAAFLLAPMIAAGQRRQITSVPSGTEIKIRLLDQLHTGETETGQTFTGTVLQPVVVAGRTILAKDAKVSGRAVEVVSSGRLKRPASITLELTQAGGRSIRTEPLRIDGKSHLLRNVGLIGGGAAAGAVIGGIAGGKKGAAIGAAVGAGAGTATAFMTGAKEIVLPVETELPFVAAGAATSPTAVPGTGTAARTASKAATTGSGGRAAGVESAETYTGTGGAGTTPQAADLARARSFSGHDQQIIRQYFQAQRANLPPGLAKRGGRLPPGLERHLQRNGTLPPGLQRRIEPFPAELTRQLPKLPSGLSRVLLAGRALILDRNNKILDLMRVFE